MSDSSKDEHSFVADNPSPMRLPLLFVAPLTASLVLAQAGSVDPSFDPTDLSGGTANGLNGSCRAIATQADGKILVAGDFNLVNGVV